MKRQLIIALIALTSGAVHSQSGKNPYLTKTFPSSSVKTVDARTQGGSIEVSGTAGAEARVDVYVSSNNWKESISKEEIQQRLNEDYELEVSLNGGKITATAKSKNHLLNWKKTLSIGFKIYVPVNTSTDLSTSGGSINLDNLSGTQEFRTSGGSLTVSKVSGSIDGHTSGGSINVSDSKDDIDLETSGGSIDARHCSGKIKLNTSGGSLTLKDLKGNVRATTSGGSVDGTTIDGELFAHTSGGSVTLSDLTCSVDASTSGGGIDVEIKELRDYVKLHNSSGHVDLQLPANKGIDLKLYGDKIKTGTLASFSGSWEDHAVSGKLNGGGVPVTVDAGSGHVNVTFK